MPDPESRTFLIDDDVIDAMASKNPQEWRWATEQLPEELTMDEVSDIGLQVNLTETSLRAGRKLEQKVLFRIGVTALYNNSDLITAKNVANELLHSRDFIGWFMLSARLRKAKNQIISSIQSA